jgi:hypothetical protein
MPETLRALVVCPPGLLPVDPQTGESELDTNGEVVLTGSGILVRWSEVEYLDFIEFPPPPTGPAPGGKPTGNGSKPKSPSR